MGKPAVLLRHKLIALCAAALLACGLAPAMSLADDSQADSVAASFVFADSEGSGEAATPNSSSAEPQQVSTSQDVGASRVAPMLASGLFGSSAGIVSSDVALDAADPVVGSFTVNGLTYAVGSDGLTLVAVDAAASDGALDVPATVTYNDVAYSVTAVGPYAFYLSGATDVALPASIASVDDRAFRSSDVARIEVDPANPNLASFDGALYDAPLNRLLLIPEGRKGSVLLSCETEVVEASVFSHCSLVEAISVEEGGAAFSSWEGLLYNASGQTLLRVPAGATDITIKDGCTTIAAGAMEGCANLERINAPASVTSISPDVFESVPTVALPAQSAMQVDSVAGPLAGPGYEGDARSASADSSAEGESADSVGAEGEAEVSSRRVVAESQGLSAPLTLPDLGSTSASPSAEAEAQPSSQDDASSGVASSLLDQENAPTNFIPQLTAMVALSTTDDNLPEIDLSSIKVALPEGASQGVWQSKGLDAVEVMSNEGIAPVVDALSQAATNTVTYYKISVDPNGHTLVYTAWRSGSQYDHGTISSLWTHEWTTGYHTGATYFDPMFVDSYISFANGTPGWRLDRFSRYPGGPKIGEDYWGSESLTAYANWLPNTYTIAFDSQGGSAVGSVPATYDQDATLPEPIRTGFAFKGWDTKADGTGTRYQAGVVRNLTTVHEATVILYAQWERVDFDIGFDVDSEPGDADYPGDKKDDQTVNKNDGPTVIEDPKRPGYVFEGWVIPTEDGTEAVDQELVYQGSDGKWYVDASKLPNYADSDGKVQLTARWTSVISVDVPSSVTFYADLVTQGQESREGAASSAFGQSKVENQSEIDLRVVGLESSAVKTEGSTLGADSILKKAEAATPSTSTQKLLSLYPSTKQWTAEDLQDPDAVGGDKAATAVDFDLDDILLEKSFKADDFTIAAGSTLNMGYRLNLSETGQQLDYDKLSTLSEGQSASIANVSYCFGLRDMHIHCEATGSSSDGLYLDYDGKTYGTADIKRAADCISRLGESSPCYPLYSKFMNESATFKLKVDGIDQDVQIAGIRLDSLTYPTDDRNKAGFTFAFKEMYALNNVTNTKAGTVSFNTQMRTANTNSGGWLATDMRKRLRTEFAAKLDPEVNDIIAPVNKFQQLYGGATADYLQKSSETIWIPSLRETHGYISKYNDSETLNSVPGYTPFQYPIFQGNNNNRLNPKTIRPFNGISTSGMWWLRSVPWIDDVQYCCVSSSNGDRHNFLASESARVGIVPFFCI